MLLSLPPNQSINGAKVRGYPGCFSTCFNIERFPASTRCISNQHRVGAIAICALLNLLKSTAKQCKLERRKIPNELMTMFSENKIHINHRSLKRKFPMNIASIRHFNRMTGLVASVPGQIKLPVGDDDAKDGAIAQNPPEFPE